MEKELYTKKLIENVYYGDKQEECKKIQDELQRFFLELQNRRRDEPLEGGLQASIILMPDVFAAKVNENDGMDTHKVTTINLLRYIKNKDEFYTNEATGEYGLLYNEARVIIKDGVQVSISDGENNIMVAIVANNKIKSIFQLEILIRIIDNIKNIKGLNVYTHVNVGLKTPEIKIEFDEIDDKMYTELMTALNTAKDKLENKKDEESR